MVLLLHVLCLSTFPRLQCWYLYFSNDIKYFRLVISRMVLSEGCKYVILTIHVYKQGLSSIFAECLPLVSNKLKKYESCHSLSIFPSLSVCLHCYCLLYFRSVLHKMFQIIIGKGKLSMLFLQLAHTMRALKIMVVINEWNCFNMIIRY